MVSVIGKRQFLLPMKDGAFPLQINMRKVRIAAKKCVSLGEYQGMLIKNWIPVSRGG